MKIAVFHELPVGGARRAVNEVSKVLRKKHTVDLFMVSEKVDESESGYYDKIFFYKFIPKKWRGKNWRVRLHKDTIELFKLYFLHKEIAKQIEKGNYDLLFVNASQFIESPFILRFVHISKVFYCHDPYYRLIYDSVCEIPKNLGIVRTTYERVNRLIRKVLDKQNFNCADLLVANSQHTKKEIKKVHNRESIVAYLGVNASFFTPGNNKKKYDILFIGSTRQIDGYELLVSTLKYVNFQPRIKTIFTDKEWVSDNTLRDMYRKSKIVVCFGMNEPFGLIPLEAMSSGVPVIAVNEGGYKESVVDGETGFLVRRDPRMVAQKIKLLLSDYNLTAIMGIKAREHIAKNWTWEKSVEKLEIILKKFLDSQQ